MFHEVALSGISSQAISSEIPFETYTLSNGIRLVHQRVESPVAYCGLMADTGSRDELPGEYGAAHLTEHLFFKETGKRRSHHILSRMENVGGDLNAYTTKEDTCIHAAFLCDHYARALELFGDLMFNSKIGEKTLEVEKKVVIDEIRSSKDNPSELIFDEFEELLFPGHPLGCNTLGSVRSVSKLSKTVVEGFIARNYHTERMVLSSSGNIAFQRLIAYAEKYLKASQPHQKDPIVRLKPPVYIPFEKIIDKKNHQSHCIMGAACADLSRKFRIEMAMLANLLAGPGMNSRLNMSLRERNGWVYHVEASYMPYSDAGIFHIYFGTDKSNLKKCKIQVEKELSKLKEFPLTDSQLKKLRRQIAGQYAIASDNRDAGILAAGKSMLMFGRTDNLRDFCTQINQVSADDLCQTATRVFNRLSCLIYR